MLTISDKKHNQLTQLSKLVIEIERIAIYLVSPMGAWYPLRNTETHRTDSIPPSSMCQVAVLWAEGKRVYAVRILGR